MILTQLALKKKISGLNILLIEDNLLNQFLVKRFLIPEGVNLTIADDGKEGVDLISAANLQFDIILMDLQMPIMDGYEATKAIREGKISTLNKDIAIIAVTADAMPKTKDRVLEIGMNDYMTKPIDKNELFDKINQFSIKPKLKIA